MEICFIFGTNTVLIHMRMNLFALFRDSNKVAIHRVAVTKTFEKLTPEQQKIIKEESKRASQWFRDRMQQEEGELIQKLKDKGMKVMQVCPSQVSS